MKNVSAAARSIARLIVQKGYSLHEACLAVAQNQSKLTEDDMNYIIGYIKRNSNVIPQAWKENKV